MKRPNVLLFMSDEHRFDITGYANNQVVRTPNLDKMANDSVIFHNAYTPSPVCIPARQCIAAGQYPKTCKVEPKKFPSREIDENVNLIDLFATLGQMCGIRMPDNTESRDLTDLMLGNNKTWQNETVSQWGGINLMIKKDNLKYHWYGEDKSELLFDLEKDGKENQDFSKMPEYKADMEYFQKRKEEYGF